MSDTKKQTYRAAVQEVIQETWLSYDKAGGLRDCATQEEKDTWDKFRGLMYKAAHLLAEMDNSMSVGRATTEL
jgi:hypothetical protein